MRYLAATAISIVLCIGTGAAVHLADNRQAYNSVVQNYNAGFVDGMCAGSTSVAEASYHFDCKGN